LRNPEQFGSVTQNAISVPLESRIYDSVQEIVAMAGRLRITVDELKRRLDAGEDFTIIDTRSPEAWAQSETMIPESVRIPVDQLEQKLSAIPRTRPVVAYCT
jgi:rhodanese-like protein